jgi:uncharacterized membrane protein HdeD (DUF308 family)
MRALLVAGLFLTSTAEAQVAVSDRSLSQLGEAGLTIGALVGCAVIGYGLYSTASAIKLKERPSDLVLALDYLIATIAGAGGIVMLAMATQVDDPTGHAWLLAAGAIFEGFSAVQLGMTIGAHAQPSIRVSIAF